MDFDLSEEQEAVRGLAEQVFAGCAGIDRVRAVEQTEDRIDEELWKELAGTGLLSLALPERFGGAGLGLVELCVLLREQGRTVAPVPLWPALLGALAVAGHGSPEQQQAWLPRTADGSLRLTLALEEFGPADPAAPATVAVRDGDLWRLTGSKAAVPALHGARRVVVSATGPDGPALFLLDPAERGVTAERAETTTREISSHLALDGAVAEPLGGPGALAALLDRVRTALAAVQVGVAEGALRQAAAYLGEREQFGRPLATFQAVAHQVADCYIDIEAMRVTLWQAAWLIDRGEDPGTAVLVAKWWADDAGQRVVHRVVHLHGGMGVDVDYPVHRHLLWGKQIAGTLGSAGADLDRLGALLAAGTGAAS